MNKCAKNLSLLVCSLLSIGLFSACIDNDYDLDGVDMTVGIGNGEIILPASSTDIIRLSEVLELNSSNTLVEKANGDYYYTQSGNDVAATNTRIEPISVQIKNEVYNDFEFSINPQYAKRGNHTTDLNQPVDINLDQVVYSFGYVGSMPDEVESLSEATINGGLNLRASFSQVIKSFVPVIAELYVEFPSYLPVTKENIKSQQNFTLEGNKIKFTNVSTASDLGVNITFSKIDFTKSNTSLGSLSTANKQLAMDANVKMGIKIDNIVVGSALTQPTTCKISSAISINQDLVITKVRGRFNPSINLDNIGTINVTGIPDFLTNDGVVVDLDNPQLSLNIASNLDVPGFVSGTLTAYKDGKTTTVVRIPEVNIKKNTTSKICICRHATGDMEPGVQVVEIENLSTLLSPIPDRIVFSGSARADNTVDADFVLGNNYSLKPSYSFEAPLAFGKDAKIVYTDSFDDFNDDIKDLEIADGTYLEFTGIVENKVPAYLNASAVALDINGNEMPQSEVAVIVDGEIAASKDGKTAETSSLKITLKPSKNALKKLDGLKFTVSGSAKAEGDMPTVTGQTLNAQRHSLIVKDIKIKMVGKVIADLN